MGNLTIAQLIVLAGGGGSVPTTIPVPSFFVSPTGSDLNPGTSQSFPWKTNAKVAATVFPTPSIILWQTGGTWGATDPLIIPQAGLTIGSYGGGAAPIFNGLVSATGVVGDWAEYASNGTTPQAGTSLWRRTLPGNVAKRLMLIVAGAMPITPDGFPTWSQSTAAKVNSAGKWRYQYNTAAANFYLFVFSIPNPALGGLGTLEITSAPFALDAFNLQVTVRDAMVAQGWNYGAAVGGGTTLLPTSMTNFTSQLNCAKNYWLTNGDVASGGTNGGVYQFTGCTGFDCGYSNDGSDGKGDHGIDVTAGAIDRNGVAISPAPLQTVLATFTDCKIDNAKEDCITMRFCSITSLVTITGTNPAGYTSSYTVPPKSENSFDIKSSNVTITGTYAQSQSLGTLTAQIDARDVTSSNNLMSVTGANHPCVSIAETDDRFISDHSGYYSEGASCFQQRFMGKVSSGFYDIAVTNFAGASIPWLVQSGTFNPTYCTGIAAGLTSVCQALYYNAASNAANVAGIELVSGPSGGNYTYRFVCAGTNQNFFGPGSVWTLGGLTGASAALNGVVTITDCYPSGIVTTARFANFLVPAASSPPATVDITGMTLTAIPFVTVLAACALIGTTQSLRATVVASLSQAAYNANYAAGTAATEQVVQRAGVNYTVAKTITNVALAGNLKTDTAGRWGGTSSLDSTLWAADYSTTVPWFDRLAVSSLVIGANGTVTATTTLPLPARYTTGRKVCIINSTPTYANGWRWITVTGASTFTYPAPRYPKLSADVTATGTIFALDGSLAATSAGLATAPVITTPYATNFQGAALLVAPNFGAV